MHRESLFSAEGGFELKILLEDLILPGSTITVVVNEDVYTFKPNIVKVTGVVRKRDGSPVKKPLIKFTSNDIAMIGDDEGNYEMVLCQMEKEIAIFDEHYSVSSLEIWLRNFYPDADTTMDFVIDQLELCNINMWAGNESDYIHFIPMSVVHVQNVMQKGYDNQIDIMKDPDAWPKLNRRDVKVFVNNQECEVLSFVEVDDFMFTYEGEKYCRPSYVLSIPRNTHRALIRIEVELDLGGNDGDMKGFGEGYYLW